MQSHITACHYNLIPTSCLLVIHNTDYHKFFQRTRKPAFTDRILSRIKPNAYQNFELDLKQVEYRSHPQYKQSDHKPVTAIFHIKTKWSHKPISDKALSLYSVSHTGNELEAITEEIRPSVTFLPITDWKVNHNCTARYTITPNDDQAIAQLSQWDWIGMIITNIDTRLFLEGLAIQIWVSCRDRK